MTGRDGRTSSVLLCGCNVLDDFRRAEIIASSDCFILSAKPGVINCDCLSWFSFVIRAGGWCSAGGSALVGLCDVRGAPHF